MAVTTGIPFLVAISPDTEQENLETRSESNDNSNEGQLSHRPKENVTPSKTTSTSKRAPVVMLLSILCGTILVIVHDSMNR